ncbi:MAG: DUF5996 family protein [Acidimicrobiia bacterium]|nr:DUF5996 family protein [Acidimicrobiia bacterium]
MNLPPLPTGWEPTRVSLHRYVEAMTALPRVGAKPDRRWAHVAMHPAHLSDGGIGFATAPTPLASGASLVSTLDVHRDLIRIEAGADTLTIDLNTGPSPRTVGSTIAELVQSHGSSFEIDTDRYANDDHQIYERWRAHAWHDNALWVSDTLSVFNTGIEGEISGPHLWPHGFDIATEWFSHKTVNAEGANAQIAVGFYPAGDAYFYANPWPFDNAWASADLPEGVTWHLEGWQGAMLAASDLDGDNDRERILEFARAIHHLTYNTLWP